jgi:hypothetical protein
MLLVLRKRHKVPQTKTGRRKLRLFACASCRLVWDLLYDPRHRNAVEVAERFADGLVTKAELERARSDVGWTTGGFLREDTGSTERTARSMAEATTHAQPLSAAFEVTAMPLLLAGRTSADKTLSAVKLAEAMYAGQNCSFALGDALLEAGHPQLAEHFAREKWHPKGCWVVDLLLAKE